MPYCTATWAFSCGQFPATFTKTKSQTQKQSSSKFQGSVLAGFQEIPHIIYCRRKPDRMGTIIVPDLLYKFVSLAPKHCSCLRLTAPLGNHPWSNEKCPPISYEPSLMAERHGSTSAGLLAIRWDWVNGLLILWGSPWDQVEAWLQCWPYSCSAPFLILSITPFPLWALDEALLIHAHWEVHLCDSESEGQDNVSALEQQTCRFEKLTTKGK
jgi:hypothetical protein